MRRWGWIITLAALASSATCAFAATPRLGVYSCNGERQVVARCAERCEVDYPDRPERNGFQVQASENAEQLAARLAACVLIANLDGTPVSGSRVSSSRVLGGPASGRSRAAGRTTTATSGACQSVTGCDALPGAEPRSRRAPGYDRTQQVPGYDNRQGQPGYDHPQTTPGYDHPQTVPGY